jgi:hypothetical protein
MSKLFLLTFFVCLALAQQYLPKEGPLPITDIFSGNIGRSGETDFYKTVENSYSTLISSYPVRPNAVTKVSFLMVQGNRFVFGCGQGFKSDILTGKFCGQVTLPKTVGYSPWQGLKLRNNDYIPYGPPSTAGDTITMTIDLRPFKNTVSFAKNGLPMGIAFAGLNNWDTDIYILFSIFNVNDRIRITGYSVE